MYMIGTPIYPSWEEGLRGGLSMGGGAPLPAVLCTQYKIKERGKIL